MGLAIKEANTTSFGRMEIQFVTQIESVILKWLYTNFKAQICCRTAVYEASPAARFVKCCAYSCILFTVYQSPPVA
jgi:hypothetical protein